MKILNISLLILLLLNNIKAQEGWFWQNPLPQGNPLHSVFFVNENIGWAVGGITWYSTGTPSLIPSNGIILKTTDAGVTWISQKSGVNRGLNSVFFVSKEIGWAAGEAGTIIKTTDGGETWVKLDNPLADKIGGFNNIYFTSELIGYAIGGEIYGISISIYKTTDGGFSWVKQQNPFAENKMLRSMDFIDDEHGWIVGDHGAILSTTNGGENWEIQTTDTLSMFNAVDFVSDTLGWAAGYATVRTDSFPSRIEYGEIFKTTDGGKNWEKQFSETYSTMTSIKFVSEEVGCAAGYEGELLFTNDGGESWVKPDSITPSNLSSVCYSTSSEVYAVGDAGTMIKSIDAGKTWSPISKGSINTFRAMHFISETTGWIAGEKAVILKTTDGGNNWLKQESGLDPDDFFSDLVTIFFITPEIGWASGRSLIKTTDGGNNWEKVLENVFFNSIYFITQDTGFVVGTVGDIWKTTDGGKNWIEKESNTIRSLYSVFFATNQVGYTAGWNGVLFKTTDCGETWERIITGSSLHLSSLYFISPDTGWAAGTQIIQKTTDGGKTWENQTPKNCRILSTIEFVSKTTGWAAGEFGRIYKTTDGGENWLLQDNPANGMLNEFEDLQFVSPDKGWVVGSIGAVLKTIDGGGDFIDPTAVKPFNKILNDYSLYQNYPNPFNPSTKIRYSISNNELTIIKIYDILGNEITTLVNEEKSPGEYEITFDANRYNLSSGVYFYRLQSGSFHETKKFILIK